MKPNLHSPRTQSRTQKVGPLTKSAIAASKHVTSREARALLVSIAICADRGDLRPRARKLAEMAGIGFESSPTFDEVINELARAGLLWQVKRRATPARYVWLWTGKSKIPAYDLDNYQRWCARQHRAENDAGAQVGAVAAARAAAAQPLRRPGSESGSR